MARRYVGTPDMFIGRLTAAPDILVLAVGAQTIETEARDGQTARDRLAGAYRQNPVAERLGVQPQTSTLMFVDRSGAVVALLSYTPRSDADATWEGCYGISGGTCFSTCGRPLVLKLRQRFERQFLRGRPLNDLQVIQLVGQDEIASIVPAAWRA